MICSKCGEEKTQNEMANKVSYCKRCDAERAKLYRRTPKGHAYQIINDQIRNCIDRGHERPLYTNDEFLEWLLSSSEYKDFYYNWAMSGFDKNMSPSIDRINEYKTYSFDNIRLCTWLDNNKSAYTYRKKGLNNKQSRIVGKLIDGKVVETYHSINEAARKNTCRAAHISEVAYGKRNSAGGNKWVFLSDAGHKNIKEVA